MELVRIVRKSMLCIICLFIAMICISIYQINYNQDSKVYKYYKEIIADYNNIKNDNVAFTAEKLTKTYEQYKEEDSEYIDEAAGQLSESIDAIKTGAKFERYSFIFSIPAEFPIWPTELNRKHILKTHKRITASPAFNTAI